MAMEHGPLIGDVPLTPGLLHHLHVEPLGRRTFEDKGAARDGVAMTLAMRLAGRDSTIEFMGISYDFMGYEWDSLQSNEQSGNWHRLLMYIHLLGCFAMFCPLKAYLNMKW